MSWECELDTVMVGDVETCPDASCPYTVTDSDGATVCFALTDCYTVYAYSPEITVTDGVASEGSDIW